MRRALAAGKRRTAAANLVAVESLKEGDEILTPWGRDHIDTISEAYNVALTERKRQLPLRRNGRPVLVKRADPAAASRRSVTAFARAARLIGPNGQVIRPGDGIKDFRDETFEFVKIVQMPNDQGSSGKIEVFDGAESHIFYPSVFDAEIRASRRVARASTPLGRPLVVYFRGNNAYDTATRAKRVLLYQYNVESTVDDRGQLTIQMPRDPKVVRQVDELLDDFDAQSGRRAMPLSRRGPAAEANFRLLSTLMYAKLAPVLRKIGMSQAKADQLTALLKKARDADDAYQKLVDAIPDRADYIAKAIGLDEAETGGLRVPPGYKQTTVDQLLPGDEIIIYPHGKDVVEKVSSRRKAVKTRDGLIIAGKTTVYVKASRRRRTASAALPLLAVARVAPILLRFGLTSGRAAQVAGAVSKASTAYEAFQLLRDELGTAAQGVARALGLDPEKTKVAYDKATAPVAGSRRQRRAASANFGPGYSPQRGSGPSKDADRAMLKRAIRMDDVETQDDIMEAFDRRGAKSALRLVKELLGDDMWQMLKDKGFGGDMRGASRRSARAGWRGATEEQQPVRQKFGSLARMLAQFNVTDPRKLPDEARESFNALLAATVERTELPAKEVLGQAVKQARAYAEQMSTSASRRTASADESIFTKKDVFESLDNAIENGYDEILQDSALDIAQDLGNFDATFEDFEDDPRLHRYIQEWLDSKSKGRFGNLGLQRRSTVKASTIDDMEMAVKLLVDYQVTKPSMLPPDAERKFWSIMAKVSSAKRSQTPWSSMDKFAQNKYKKLRASRVTKLARVAVRCAMRNLGKKPVAAAAVYRGFKDTAKVAQLATHRVSLKVDSRQGTYEGAQELGQHIDAALQAAGINAYDVYVR